MDMSVSMERLRVELKRHSWAWLSPVGFVPSSVIGAAPTSGYASDYDYGDFMPLDGLDEAAAVYVDMVRSSRSELDDIHDDCEEITKEYGRGAGEWHRYDMVLPGHEEMVRKAELGLYALGWVFLSHSTKPASLELDVTGAQDILDAVLQDIEVLAGSVGCVLRRRDADPIRIAGLRRSMNQALPVVILGPALDGTFTDGPARLSWERALADIDRDGYGWLSPDGEILTCTLHKHLDILMKRGEQVERFVALRDARECKNAAWTEWKADGSHLGNHLFRKASQFDSVEQARKSSVVEALYEEGWLRLARGDMLVAEGRKAHLRERKYLLSSIAYHLGLGYKPQMAGTSDAQPNVAAR